MYTVFVNVHEGWGYHNIYYIHFLVNVLSHPEHFVFIFIFFRHHPHSRLAFSCVKHNGSLLVSRRNEYNISIHVRHHQRLHCVFLDVASYILMFYLNNNNSVQVVLGLAAYLVRVQHTRMQAR